MKPLEALARLLAAGGGQGGEGAPVPGALHDDRLRRGLAVLVAVQAHELQRAFVRFRARVAEEHFLQPRQFAQPIRERFLLAYAIDVRRVNQPAELLAERGDEARMRMAKAVDRDAGQRIEIFLTLLVVQPRAAAVRERDGQPVVGVHQVRHDARSGRMAERKTRRRNTAAAFARL
jgi:hypothetical protein